MGSRRRLLRGLAAAERLCARITGSGDVLIGGQARVVQTVTGSGKVRRLDDRPR